MPLHAVGLAKEHGEQGVAVVDAGERVHLRIARRRTRAEWSSSRIRW